MSAILFALPLLVVLSACAPRRLALPTGPGTPVSDVIAPFDQASSGCRNIRTMTAEIRMSGRVGPQRMRGTLLAGLAAPDALRLEAVAPFGPPVFILVANGGPATLLLARDDRVLTGVSAADILDALAGVRLDPAALRAILTGCVSAAPRPSNGRRYQTGWLAVDLGPHETAFLRDDHGRWRIVAGQAADLTIEYRDYQGDFPLTVTVQSEGGSSRPAVNLALALSQLAINTDLKPTAFQVDVPRDAAPVSLEELRAAGPLGERAR